MAEVSVHFRYHRNRLLHSPPRRIQSLKWLSSCARPPSNIAVERLCSLRSNHYPDLARWVPRGLPRQGSDTGTQLAYCEWRVSALYAPQFSERYLPEPFYFGDRPLPREPWRRWKYILGPRIGGGIS